MLSGMISLADLPSVVTPSDVLMFTAVNPRKSASPYEPRFSGGELAMRSKGFNASMDHWRVWAWGVSGFSYRLSRDRECELVGG